MRNWIERIAAVCAALAMSVSAQAQEPRTLRVVMHSDIKVLDPVWSGAYIVRNYGYLIYDTLFALDEKFQPKPQMVETWSASDDRKTWTFTLREGLEWHDGKPVTAD